MSSTTLEISINTTTARELYYLASRGFYYNTTGTPPVENRFEIIDGSPEHVAPSDEGTTLYWHKTFEAAVLFRSYLEHTGRRTVALWDLGNAEPDQETPLKKGWNYVTLTSVPIEELESNHKEAIQKLSIELGTTSPLTPLSPSDFHYRSHHKVFWTCQKCNEPYLTGISDRANFNVTCPRHF